MTEYAPIIEINCETGERVFRQPTPEEINQMKIDEENYIKWLENLEIKKAALEEDWHFSSLEKIPHHIFKLSKISEVFSNTSFDNEGFFCSFNS